MTNLENTAEAPPDGFGLDLGHDLMIMLKCYGIRFRGPNEWDTPEYARECLDVLVPAVCFFVAKLHREADERRATMHTICNCLSQMMHEPEIAERQFD